MEHLKVLILGSYGTFGGRLARLLADETRLTLVVAGRSYVDAAAFCASLGAKASLVPRGAAWPAGCHRRARARPQPTSSSLTTSHCSPVGGSRLEFGKATR